MTLYLASQSPRRRQLLQQINIEHEVLSVEIDERWNGNESAKDYVIRMAKEKAEAGMANLTKNSEDHFVLAADTSVVLDNVIMGKAETNEDATRMLRSLSARRHDVLSAVCLMSDEKQQIKLSISQVHFKPLTDEEIKTYCDSSEPIGKAGGYAIQGLAASFISHLEGSYSGVMGLPLYETQQLLKNVLNKARNNDRQ